MGWGTGEIPSEREIATLIPGQPIAATPAGDKTMIIFENAK